ncbi:hypothetical protein M1P56_19755 [Streptomyces sp. HU2014]|uniref:hypothetical protein n=1 Tax=Streptomyces sp. HU2014 TaxID=2939414 RepID=UPI00200CDDAD|nr:hypothetical protein [Streptomyces sp. HU2014]UQI46422.1 hypothetical protein M1P56_19755 [Streptomyces sp. HU2014]
MAVRRERHGTRAPGRRVRRAAVVAAVAGGAVLPVVPPASTASGAAAGPVAADTCQVRPDARHTDWTPMNFLGDVVCPHNLVNTRVQSTTQSPVNGRMAFSPSWFVCWKPGTPQQGSDIWYYTQADSVSGNKRTKGWGYLPAAELQVTKHPVPGLARCSWSRTPTASGG